MRFSITSHFRSSASSRVISESPTWSSSSDRVSFEFIGGLTFVLLCDIGVAEVTITKWEEENVPFKLPDDFKAFLQISDGLSLNWKIKKNDMVFNLGMMHLNKLREIRRIRDEKFRFASMVDDDDSSEDETLEDSEER